MIFPGVPEGCPGVVADTGGGLSSILSGSFFGKVADDLNDARRTLESKTPDPNAVASQVNDLVGSIGSLTCGDEVALALDAEGAGDLEKKAKTMNWCAIKTSAILIALACIFVRETGTQWDMKRLS